jgi:hypothetical protein
MVVKFIERIPQGWDYELNVLRTDSIADSLIPNIDDNVYINGTMYEVVKKVYLYSKNEDKEIHIHLRVDNLSKTVK